jgi:hypothetical protein
MYTGWKAFIRRDRRMNQRHNLLNASAVMNGEETKTMDTVKKVALETKRNVMKLAFW